MAKLNFRFEWYDDEKRVMRLIAEGNWNWRDYHAGARAAAFSAINHPHDVTVLFDLRESTRESAPAGIAAHAMTFTKQHTQALNGQVIVIGLDAASLAKVPREADGTLPTKEGCVYFVDTDEQAQALIEQIQAQATS